MSQNIKSSNDIQFVTLRDFQGMIQRQDPDKIPDNYSPLLVNQSLVKPGIWSKRQSCGILSTTRSGGVRGISEYLFAGNSDNTRLRMWRGGANAGKYELQTYSVTGNSYTAIDTSQGSIGYMQSVNFKNRIYHVSPTNYLSYESGGAITTLPDTAVFGDSCLIKAETIATAQGTLYIGNITTLNGKSFNYQDRVYYSVWDGNQTDVFYNPSDGFMMADRIEQSTSYFSVLEPVVGLFSFGQTGLMYVFTKNACWEFDQRYAQAKTGPRKICNIGLINKYAVTECNGWLIWMDYEGRIWAWAGSGLPLPITWELQDDENGEAILNNLDRNSLDGFCAGSLNNQFYFSIKTVSYRGTTLTNAVLKGLISQSRSVVLYSVDTFPTCPAMFCNVTINKTKRLVYGSLATDDIYLLNNPSSSETFDSYARTKFFDFNLPFYDKTFYRLFIKYRPQPTTHTFLRVRYSLDGETTYVDLSDPENGIDTWGTIDMGEGYTSTTFDNVKILNLPPEAKGRSISVEVGNGISGEDYEVSGIGFEFSTEGYDYTIRA